MINIFPLTRSASGNIVAGGDREHGVMNVRVPTIFVYGESAQRQPCAVVLEKVNKIRRVIV